MKKEAPAFIWHKRHGKMMSSKFLNVLKSPQGENKGGSSSVQDPSQRFWQALKMQIKKSLSIVVFGIFCFSVAGCQPKPAALPLGIWHRDAVYVNGELSSERKATFIFERSAFRYFESGCEMKGVASYQREAIILGVQESDCQGADFGDRIYCGFDLDPDGMTLRLTRENKFNDSVREIYHRKGAQ